MNIELSIIILAAGQSKRMKTSLPKILHKLGGVPLLERVIQTARQLKPQNIYVVHNDNGQVREALKHSKVQWVHQKNQLGTGHAVSQALPLIPDNHHVLVLYGDVPLISAETLQQLITETPQKTLGILITQLSDPKGYGRIIRNKAKKITAIVEEKDATEKQRAVKEINTGILTASAKNLKTWLPKVKNKNTQGEFYLTDIIAMAKGNGVKGIYANCAEETQGVNDRQQLAKLERYYQHQITQKFMLQGVTFMDPQRFDLRGELIADQDVTIDVNVILEGKVNIGSNSKIGPNCFLRNVEMGKNVEILANCVIEDSKIADECRIGPFARIRPGTILHEKVHVGNFVEIKKSELGEGSKANHLAYVGDAIVGKNVNIGAGVITCNYDGVNKYQTIIKDGAFIGSDSQLVAPVTVGENAYIASGSTITTDAPSNQLTISRARQVTIEKWKKPEKKK